MSTNIRVEKICEFCEKTFIAKTLVTRYCSPFCNKKGWRAKQRYENLKLEDNTQNQGKTLPIPSGIHLSIIQEKQFLTVPEVAKLLRLSKATIYRLIKEGDLKAVSFSERTTRIKRSEIDKLFN